MNIKLDEIIYELRNKIRVSVIKNSAKYLLFSGGLDTSILAFHNPNVIGINVSFEDKGEDVKFAEIVSKILPLEIYKVNVLTDEAISSIQDVIKILKSFDPAIPNDLVVYFGVKFAKELNAKSIITGDGADELFAGYSYMKDVDDLEDYIKKISSQMQFSSNKIGEFFDVKVLQPYCDKKIVDFAINLPKELKIKNENDNTYGKWILRKSYEGLLPQEIIWQTKRPLEDGSGMTKLREIISKKISDEEFEEKQKLYPVRFLNKEHLYYYEIYRNVVGEIPKPKENEKECPYCRGGMNIFSFHCSTCGGVLSWKN